MTTIRINGYDATVLDANYYVALVNTDAIRIITEDLAPGPVTNKTCQLFLTRAETEGFDKVDFVCSRYVEYSRRDVMRKMSGWVTRHTTYRRQQGRWVRVVTTEQSLY